MHKIALALLLAVCAAAPAAADDTAGVPTGGLVFSPPVTVSQATLRITPAGIAVEYRVKPAGTAPVETRMSFTGPRIPMDYAFSGLDVPFDRAGGPNVLAASVTAGGKPLKTTLASRAFVDGADVSAPLEALKLPFGDPGDRLLGAVGALSAPERDVLAKAKLIEPDGCGATPEPCPLWVAETVMSWTAALDPTRETVIRLGYVPWTTMLFLDTGEPLIGGAEARFPKDKAGLARFCIDDGGWRGLKKRGPQALVSGVDVALDPSTPIGELRLVVDKGDPKAMVSLCANGIKKTAPTVFETVVKTTGPLPTFSVLYAP